MLELFGWLLLTLAAIIVGVLIVASRKPDVVTTSDGAH